MDIGHQFSLTCKGFKGSLLENCLIILDVIKDFRLEYHIASIDGSTIGEVLLTEGLDGSTLNIQHAFLLGQLNSCQCCQLAMTAVKLQQLVDIDIADTITVCHHKRLVTHIFLYTFDASTCHRVIASINNSHLPRFQTALMESHLVLVVAEVKRDVAIMQEIVGKPLLDILLTIACTDDELIMPVIGILLHDMPKYRHATDLNHRFRLKLRLLGNASAKTTC